MNNAPSPGTLVAILPCNDIDVSEHFYERLGFVRRVESGVPDYRILANSAGGHLHLTSAEKGWLLPGRNPCGLYLYLEDVDGIAAALQDLGSGRRGPEHKPWGMYMNFQFLIRTKRLYALVGRAACATPPEADHL
jgi:hypothetical protein